MEGAPLMVICGGEVIEIIHSQFGTQQGDVMGTSYFGFATMKFAEELAELVPDAQISWIVDDLTVAGSVEEMGKVARFAPIRLDHGSQASSMQMRKVCRWFGSRF